MEVDKKKLKRYLLLFGLKPNFLEDDLKECYRTLAKLNHPDLNSDSTSEMRMTILNDGYHFLKLFVKLSPNEKESLSESPLSDEVFFKYKKAFEIMKKAFTEYYGESESKINSGNSDILKERLLLSKKEFALLINNHPYNRWTNDAIDKVCSINKWL